MSGDMLIRCKQAATPTDSNSALASPTHLTSPRVRDSQPVTAPHLAATGTSIIIQNKEDETEQHETPDLPSKLERAKRFGHNLSQVSVANRSVHLPTPAYPTGPKMIQCRLKIGQPGDKYEQEADRVAEQLVAMDAPTSPASVQRQSAEQDEPETLQTKPLPASITPLIQRRAEQGSEQDEPETLQTKSLAANINSLIQRQAQPQDSEQDEPETLQTKPLATNISPRIQRQPQPQDSEQEAETLQTKPLAVNINSIPPHLATTGTSIIIQHKEDETEERETPDLSTQLERAKHYGHNLSQVNVGNRLTRLHSPANPIAPKMIQCRLTIGQPGDKYEQEADQVAEQVMAIPASTIQPKIQCQTEDEEEVQPSPLANSITPLVQRFSGEKEEVQTKLGVQRAADGTSQAQPSSLESRLASSKGGGSPLPDDVRTFMEPRFGADLSAVRVHTDSTAVQMNKELGAQAFTHGSNIYYGAGKSPGSDRLTAHELTHTIQQGAVLRSKRKVQAKTTQQENQNKPLQPKKLPNYTPNLIQNKPVELTTGITARIQAKADPGQILEQLQNTPPTTAPGAYQQAQAASSGALEAQKQALQQSLPKIPAPTGLPAQKSKPKDAIGRGTTAAGNKAIPAAGATKQKLGQAAKAANKIDVKESLPPRPIKPMGQNAQNQLASVGLDGSQVSTKLGKTPTVDLTGEADPSQIDLEQRQSNEQVRKQKAEAAQKINQDFGENNIFPEGSKETLQASQALSAAKAPGVNKGKIPVVPGEVAGHLNQSLAPALKERIGAEQQKYTAGKHKFDKEAAKAKTDSDREIAKLNQETSQKQLQEQKQAKAEVQASKQEWQTELIKAEKDFQDKVGKATQDQKKKIEQEKQKGEQTAAKHVAEAEQKAEQEKQKAEKEAQQKKEETNKESGFWGRVKSAASNVIDSLKKAVNFIYDNLRKAVKFIFEQAIKLATAVIDLARKAIVGLIQGLGTILRGLVNVVFAAFPEIAKKINSKIDQAIKAAVKAVNTAADLLKKAVKAALNFLAKALDTLLAGIQALYNAALDAIGKIVEALRKLLEGLGNLVAAAKQMPGHFMGQLSEEVSGMNLTEPLPFERSKEDCAKCNIPATAKGGKAAVKGGDEKAALLNKNRFTEDDFAVDQVAPFDVSPEFIASLNLQNGGEVEFGESNDLANSMEAIKAELAGGETEGNAPVNTAAKGEKASGGCCDDEQTAEAKLQEMMAQKPEGTEATQKQGQPAQQGDIPADMKTIGPLSVGQRAKYMSHQMIQGVKQWFSANWPKLLAGAIAALAAFVGLNILTGGAIMAALPALMQVVALVMGGVALANIAGHIGNYLSQGWAGNIGGAAKSLARGLAAGAVELVFALLFNAGAVIKAMKSGLKGTAKAAAGAAKNTVKTTAKSVKELGQIGAKGAKTALKNGKIMLQGVKGGFAKGAKSLDDLARQLVGKLRFNKFKIRLQGRRIQLLGHINPWIVIADSGDIQEVAEGTKDAIYVADDKINTLLAEMSKRKTAIRAVEDDILDVMEKANGHLLEIHVAKKNEDLIKRAIQEGVDATSFSNKRIAREAVQQNLRNNADDIAKWLSNEKGNLRKTFEYSHSHEIGKGAVESTKKIKYNLTKSRIILIKDSTMKLGFRILTGFPIFK